MAEAFSRRTFNGIALSSVIAAPAETLAQAAQQGADSALPSWRNGRAKQTILDFLRSVTRAGSPDFTPPDRRIAVFDNDGTLWTEQPLMPEIAFALARLRDLAPQHPEWAAEQPFRSALQGDLKGLVARGGTEALVKLAIATQAGTTPEEFRKIVTSWLRTARDSRFKRPYGELVYQPMLEVLRLFAANGFQCYVVSAGALEFLRAWTLESYGLPPERVIGSTLELAFEVQAGRADLRQLPKIASFTDGPHKVAAIADVIGRRPLAAFGNSDGDYEMLQYVTTGEGRRLGMLVHHDDADREYAYDRQATFGKLSRALDDAASARWTVISMKDDWAQVYPS